MALLVGVPEERYSCYSQRMTALATTTFRVPHTMIKGPKNEQKIEGQVDSLMKEHEPDRQLYMTGKRLDQLD